MAKCYTHKDRDAVGKCSKCGKDICKECEIDYHGKALCTECVMPLAKFYGSMHEQPQTYYEKKE